MSRPSHDTPTTVIRQQTVEQPEVSTAPETRRARVWQRKLPARIGRARTSTVIIGALFVLLGGLNFVLPQQVSGTTDVTLPDGRTIPVPNSALPSEARSTTTPAPSTTAPRSTAPATTTGAPGATPAEDDDTGTTAPGTTSRPTSGQAPSTTSSSRATTSRAPSTTAAPEESEEEQAPQESASPTG